MDDVFVIKSGDTLPRIGYIPPAGIDFSGAAVVFNAWDSSGNPVLDARPAEITTHEGELAFVYDWVAGDTVSLSKQSKCEFKVTFSNGKIETFPNDSYVALCILRT